MVNRFGLANVQPIQVFHRLDGLGGNPPPTGTSFTTSGPGTDVGSILTAMKHDANGNLTHLTDDRGGDASYACDPHDRKTAATYLLADPFIGAEWTAFSF